MDDGIKKNIVAFLVYGLILMLIFGIIKCDVDRVQKHLDRCKEKCKPNKIIEVLSKKECICDDLEP